MLKIHCLSVFFIVFSHYELHFYHKYIINDMSLNFTSIIDNLALFVIQINLLYYSEVKEFTQLSYLLIFGTCVIMNFDHKDNDLSC